MNNPLDTVLSRLQKPKPTGRDRWRSICPSCGGTNESALSIGVRDDHAVLIKCFKGCDVSQVVSALGLELHDLFPAIDRPGSGRPPLARRALLSARQAIDLIEFECLLVWTAAFNLANGHALTSEDLQRLHVAGSRIQATIHEVRA